MDPLANVDIPAIKARALKAYMERVESALNKVMAGVPAKLDVMAENGFLEGSIVFRTTENEDIFDDLADRIYQACGEHGIAAIVEEKAGQEYVTIYLGE